MDVYIVFTKKELDKIDSWKRTLPKAKGKRTFNISFISLNERNEENRLLFKAIFKASDGHKFVVCRKATMHS